MKYQDYEGCVIRHCYESYFVPFNHFLSDNDVKD